MLAHNLGLLGLEARPAVPALIKAWPEQAPYGRSEIRSALQRIDLEAAERAGIR